jgi:hypothetical protein
MTVVPATEQLVLELFIRDLGVSVDFYTALGFEIERIEEDFAVLRWDGCALLLQVSRRLPDRPSRPLANIRIMVSDVDDRWRRAKAVDAPVFVGIGNRDYGLRDFIVIDPDGFGVRFATPISSPRPGHAACS